MTRKKKKTEMKSTHGQSVAANHHREMGGTEMAPVGPLLERKLGRLPRKRWKNGNCGMTGPAASASDATNQPRRPGHR
jgi:hypothetical protein